MLFRGTLIGQASGSLAGNTFSRNRGGQYIRNRSTPVNPQTAAQTEVRGFFAQLAGLWASTLTSAQRDAWDAYAANVSVLNALGDVIFLTGFNMYIRSNVPRLQAGLARIDAGPTTFDLGTFTPTTAQAFDTLDDLQVAYTNTDAWANETGAAMLVYSSMSKSPTINFFKGPYRFAGSVLGDDTTAPTSPFSAQAPFTITDGNKTFVRVQVSAADGRLSTAQFIDVTAQA